MSTLDLTEDTQARELSRPLALLIAIQTLLLFALCAGSLPLAGCASAPDVQEPTFGVLLMAHGGSPEWNQAVEAAAAPLARHQPVEIAFGMADAASLQEAVNRLEARGVERIGVVRLFVSGESWYERTRQILGLAPGLAARPSGAEDAGALPVHAGHAHAGHSMELWRLASTASFALSRPGLLEDPRLGAVLAERARALSRDARDEDVLVLAHGPGDDGENERWLAHLDVQCEPVRAALPFRRVQAMTLREDWPEKRAEAVGRIRAFVERARAEGGTALVVPFRVQGFGPYAEVLAGLEYAADGSGLLPHPAVTRWIEERALELGAGSFERPFASR